jgi:hypothetical protein
MTHSRRLAAASLIGLIALSGCAQFKIRSDYDRSANLRALRTYAWRTDPPLPSGDPRFDNSLVDTRVREAIDRVLAEKGYTKASAAPDFLVGYHAVVRMKTDVAAIDRRYGYSGLGFGGTYLDVRTYDEGTLLIDIIDPGAKKLLWRGSATGVVLEKASAEKRHRRINEAVSEILEKFPPSE